MDSAGNVYVVDAYLWYNNLIQKFDSSGKFITKWGSWGTDNGQFRDPYGVAVDSAGNVYVADTGNQRIQKFDSSSKLIIKWGSYGSGDGQFTGPEGITVDNAGNVYVADTGNNRIQKFTSTGTFITKWGGMGFEDGQFYQAENVAVDSSGNVFVADSGNDRIQKFNPSGGFIKKWGSDGSGDGQFSGPEGITVDISGNVFVADSGNNRIQKFTSTGGYLTQWGSSGSGDGQFVDPYGVDVDSAGNVYVADNGNYRIQKFAPVIPRFVIGDILGTSTAPDTGIVVATVSTQTGIIYDTYEVVKNGSHWEIPKYWHGDVQLPEAQVDTSGLHRIDHVDPIIVIITDPTITGGDMQYTGLSLAEAQAGVIYPVEPTPGEPGSGIPLYVVGDILNNAWLPGGELVVARVKIESGQIFYGTYDVTKNGDHWEIESYHAGDFGLPESMLISRGMRRIAHADPHFVVVIDMNTNTGDMNWYRLSLAEALAGQMHGVELWQDPGGPQPSDPPRYLVGDILGNDTSAIRYVVAAVAEPEGPDAFPIYTTYEVVKNGDRWEIPKYWHEDFQADALQVFNLSLHLIDHVDPHTVIVVDPTTNGGNQSYFRLSLGEIQDGTPPALQEQVLPVPPLGNAPRDLTGGGLYKDVNGNGALDFNDVVIYFNQMDWISTNEPVSAFDFNKNGQIDFNDIVILFNEM